MLAHISAAPRSSHAHIFTSPHAIKVLDRIESFILNSDGVTAIQIERHTGLANSTVCAYLRELRGEGRIRVRKVEGMKARHNVWEAGVDHDFINADDVPESRSTVKTWAPHHVRDPLVAALFGQRGLRQPGQPSNQPRCISCCAPQGERHDAGCPWAPFVTRAAA